MFKKFALLTILGTFYLCKGMLEPASLEKSCLTVIKRTIQKAVEDTLKTGNFAQNLAFIQGCYKNQGMMIADHREKLFKSLKLPLIPDIRQVPYAPDKGDDVQEVVFSEDGNLMGARVRDGRVFFGDTKNPGQVDELHKHIGATALLFQNNMFITGTNDGLLRTSLVNTTNVTPKKRKVSEKGIEGLSVNETPRKRIKFKTASGLSYFSPQTEETTPGMTIEYPRNVVSPNNQFCAQARLLDKAGSPCELQIKNEHNQNLMIYHFDDPHEKVSTMDFASHSNMLGVGTTAGKVYNFNLEDLTMEPVARGKGAGGKHQGPVNALTISGDKIISGGHDKTVRIGDANSKHALVLPGKHTAGIQGIYKSQNHEMIATTAWDNNIHVYNKLKGKLIASLPTQYMPHTAAFDPTNTKLAVAAGPTVTLWHFPTSYLDNEKKNNPLADAFACLTMEKMQKHNDLPHFQALRQQVLPTLPPIPQQFYQNGK
ncbi:MAG: WD40 repeat domain-containing protein [Candidatus Babeliaceae bacterium]